MDSTIYDTYCEEVKILVLSDGKKISVPIISEFHIQDFKQDFEAEPYEELNDKLKFDNSFILKNSQLLLELKKGVGESESLHLVFEKDVLQEYLEYSHYIPLKDYEPFYEFYSPNFETRDIPKLLRKSLIKLCDVLDFTTKELNFEPESLTLLDERLSTFLPSAYLFDKLALPLSLYYGEILRKGINGMWDVNLERFMPPSYSSQLDSTNFNYVPEIQTYSRAVIKSGSSTFFPGDFTSEVLENLMFSISDLRGTLKMDVKASSFINKHSGN